MEWTVVVIVCVLVLVPGLIFMWLMADSGARDRIRRLLDAISGLSSNSATSARAGASGARDGARRGVEALSGFSSRGANRARATAGGTREKLSRGWGHVYGVMRQEFAEWRAVERRIREHPTLAARPELHARRSPSDAARLRFAERWNAVQASFLDDPAWAIVQADRLVQDVMAARGISPDSNGQSQLLETYRELRDEPRELPMQEQRRTMLRYRSLFESILMEEDRSAALLGPPITSRRS